MRQVLSRPSPLKKEKSKKTFKKVLIIFFVLIFFYILFGFLSHLKSLVINDVSVLGAKIVNQGEIKDKTLEFLSSNTALFYAKGNIFLYSKKDISNFILESFPRIFEVKSVERKKQQITIEIEERDATYLWCGFEKPTLENQFSEKNCFFVDQKGFVFDEAPFFTNGVYLIVYGGLDENLDPIGQTIQTQNSMKDFDTLIKDIKNKIGFNAHSIVLDAEEKGQHYILLDIFTTNGVFPKIIFNESEPFEEILNKLIPALGEKDFIDTFNQKKDKLEYIDTRFKNRIFYRFSDV